MRVYMIDVFSDKKRFMRRVVVVAPSYADRANHPVRNSRNELRPHIVVNEPGMYQLVFGSSLSQATKFKRWITHDVLPQLRRTGTYTITPTLAHMVQTTPNLVDRLYEAEFRNLAKKIGMRESDLYIYIYKCLHPVGTYETLDKLAPKKWFPNSGMGRYRRVINGTNKQVMLYKFLTELGIEHNKYQQGKLSTIMQLVETRKQFEELCEKIFGSTLEITSK